MNIEEIHFKLKPMVKDLEWTNFKDYLASNDFDRLCIKVGYGELWDSLKNTLRKYYESNGAYNRTSYISFEIFFNLLNSYYGTCQTSWNPLTVKDSEFSNFLFAAFNGYFLSGYEVSEKFTKILEDLQHLPITISQKKQLQEQFLIKLKILKENQAKRKTEEEQKVKEREQRRLQKLNQVSEINPNTKGVEILKKGYITPDNNVNTAISEWKLDLIEAISEAKYDYVIKELRAFSLEKNNSNWISSIVNISSRWHILQDQINKDTAMKSDISIELNKINQSLLNFIYNVVNTEGSH